MQLLDLPGGSVVAVLPWQAPEAVFAPLWQEPHALLLDSAGGGSGRWSFVMARPFQVLSRLDELHLPPLDLVGLDPSIRPPFVGGAAGLFGYELGRSLEPVLRRRPPQAEGARTPDLQLGLYSEVLAFDHAEERLVLLCHAWGGREPRARARMWMEHLEAERAGMKPAPTPTPVGAGFMPARLQADFTRPAYEAAIGRVIDYIHAGDAFQVNLAQRFTTALAPGDTPWALYQRLRQRLRPEHGAFLQLGDVAVCSASPERLVRLHGGLAEARPIKGTRPRGRSPEEDAALAQELLQSEKDRAENTMIADLLRNDLSRVCRDGSIEVPALCALMSLPSVHHLVSIVQGRLRSDAGPLDLIRAVFPGGSITGAPKVRAMEIIAELEPVRRGPYCGSLGYIGLDGNLDLSIAIRTITVEEGSIASFHAGGGIVADSDPAAEYEETLDKARSLAEALSGRPDALAEPRP